MIQVWSFAPLWAMEQRTFGLWEVWCARPNASFYQLYSAVCSSVSIFLVPDKCPLAGQEERQESLCSQLRIPSTSRDSRTSSRWSRTNQVRSFCKSVAQNVSDLKRGSTAKNTIGRKHYITHTHTHTYTVSRNASIRCSNLEQKTKVLITALVLRGKSSKPG